VKKVKPDGGGGGVIPNSVTGQYLTDGPDVQVINVGISPDIPSTGGTYAEFAQEGSCGGCSIEPEVNCPQCVATEIAIWIKNNSAANGQAIPIAANIVKNANGSVSVPSLIIDNRNTGATISVVQVYFSVTGNNIPCMIPSGCLAPGSYGYEVQPTVGYYSTSTKLPGIGVVIEPISMGIVGLTPSGYPNNQTNTFNRNFEIVVILGNSETGDVFKPIFVSVQP